MQMAFSGFVQTAVEIHYGVSSLGQVLHSNHSTDILNLLKTCRYAEIHQQPHMITVSISVAKSDWSRLFGTVAQVEQACNALLLLLTNSHNVAWDSPVGGTWNCLDPATLVPAVQLTRILEVEDVWNFVPLYERNTCAQEMLAAAEARHPDIDWAVLLSVLQLNAFHHVYEPGIVHVAASCRASCDLIDERLGIRDFAVWCKTRGKGKMTWEMYGPKTPTNDWWFDGQMDDTSM
jgi:hypothetical protein